MVTSPVCGEVPLETGRILVSKPIRKYSDEELMWIALVSCSVSGVLLHTTTLVHG